MRCSGSLQFVHGVGDGGEGSGFGPQDARAKSDWLHAMTLGQDDFLLGQAAFRSDEKHNRDGGLCWLARRLQRSAQAGDMLLFPGYERDCIGRNVIECVHQGTDRQQLGETRTTALFGCFLDDPLPALKLGRSGLF